MDRRSVLRAACALWLQACTPRSAALAPEVEIAGAAAGGEPLAERRTLTTREANGFVFLGAGAPGLRGPEAGVAEDPSTFETVLGRLGFAGPWDIDFARRVVLFFSHRDEGCDEPGEPRALEVRVSGLLEPVLVVPNTVCAARTHPERRVTLVAVARTSLPIWGFRLRLLDGSLQEFRLHHPLGRLPVPDPPREPPLSWSGRTRGTLGLPPLGDALLGRLDDGTFVWVARHQDASVSVLDARLTYDKYGRLGLPGLRGLIVWQPGTRRFDEVYDEYGVGRGKVSNLRRYEVNVDDARRTVQVGEQRQPLVRKLMEPMGDGTITASPGLERATFPSIPLERALGMPDGTVALVDASLVLSPERAPRICSGARAATARCSPDAREPVELERVRLPRSSSLDGPLVVRIESGQIHDVTLSGFSSAVAYNEPGKT